MFIKTRSPRRGLLGTQRIPRLSTDSGSATRLKARSRRRLAWLYRYWTWILGLALLAFVLVGAFGSGGLLGILIERKGYTDRVFAIEPARAAMHYVESLGTSPERLVIDIKHKHQEKLKAWRKLALERQQITSDLKQYVPATLKFRGEVYDAELRLKGEWDDHLKTNKWSYRIKIKGGKTMLGMSCFGIQHPRTRAYSYEWFYHQALSREGVACLRYQFLAVTINGRDLGVHALEEHFTKEMIEYNRRRQGVVIQIDADYRYHPYSNRLDVMEDELDTGIRSESVGATTIYDEEKFEAEPALAEQMHAARNLLQAFRDGHLSTHQAFDVTKLASYFAVSELVGSLYTIDDWSDKRFLYNPITSRLEPIGLEGCHDPLVEIMGAKYNDPEASPEDFHAKMFADPVFMRAYIQTLERVSRPEYVDQLLADLRPALQQQLRMLHREWPLHEYSEQALYLNAKRIRAYLCPRDGLQAYAADEQPDGTLELGAIQPLPVEVIELASASGGCYAAPPALTLPGKPRGQRVRFQLAQFSVPPDMSWHDMGRLGLVVRYRIMGMEPVREVAVIPHDRYSQPRLASDLMRQTANADTFSCLQFDEPTHTIRFAPGTSLINRNLIVPPGYTLRAGPGVVIDLAVGATMVSFSPVEFTGTEEQPVTVTSSDHAGQGLTVLNTGECSHVTHVVFRGLSTPHQGNWQLTGAITFYHSAVDLDHCEFIANDSEDGLNLVSSDFTLRHTHFESSISDAVDSDFSNGRISDCSFHEIGGDAVDFSGSRVDVDRVHMIAVADKGVSVGEGTVLFGHDIQIAQAGIGVAAKDSSEAELTEVSIRSSKVGLAVFQKKPEFGPATLRIERLTLEGCQSEYMVEDGSQLVIHNHPIPATHRDVKTLIYGDATAP